MSKSSAGQDYKIILSRLKGFILRSFDQTNKVVQNYTDHEPLALEVYNILSTYPWAQVLYLQITATNPSDTIILSLSEVEIYGDSVCPGDDLTYGRNCENLCNCAVPGEKCFVSTGNCPSGCKAGYHGQGCNKTCETGYFGMDCQNSCSNCSGPQCDGGNGKCLSCTHKGKKLPYCSEDCDPGSYGSDCKSNCSQNCVQTGSVCDVIEGKCLKCMTGFYGNNCRTPCLPNCKDSLCDVSTGNCVSCKPGYYGMTCDNVCSKNCKESLCEINFGNCTSCNSGFYGPICMTSCPTNCKDSVCEIHSGMCISCRPGFKGTQCKEECNSFTYGEDCKISCNPNCNINFTDVRYCDSNNGHCFNGCRSGYVGADCSQVIGKLEDRSDNELATGIGIGIGVMVATGIVIGIVMFIWFRRRQIPPPKQRDTTDRHYDHVDPMPQNDHQYQTLDKSADGYDFITDIVAFNKNNNSVVTGVGKEKYENISVTS